MSRDPTFRSARIQAQLQDLAELLDGELTVYLIGGGALTLDDLKDATKDIDLVVRESEEKDQLYEVLSEAGYEAPPDVEDEYQKLEPAFILQKDRRRFDVFHEQVAGVIFLSDAMVSRSEVEIEEGGLTVKSVSLNDIFLFKAVANREDDVDDMIAVAQTGIDEAVILDEIETQLEYLGEDHFISSMKHKADRLEGRGFDFDIHDEIRELYEKSQAGIDVKRAIEGIQNDNLMRYGEYNEQVKKSDIRSRIDAERASIGIEWLRKIGEIETVSGEFVVVSD